MLGKVENNWLAIADADDTQLIGYVPMKAGVAADRYEEALRNDRPRPRRASKQVCVDVGGASKACRKANTATGSSIKQRLPARSPAGTPGYC